MDDITVGINAFIRVDELVATLGSLADMRFHQLLETILRICLIQHAACSASPRRNRRCSQLFIGGRARAMHEGGRK